MIELERAFKDAFASHPPLAVREAMRIAERAYLRALLDSVDQNVTRAALIAKCNRTTFYKRMAYCGIQTSRAHFGQWDRPIPTDLREVS